MTVNFQQRPSSTHGPMIYRMTSVNPSMFKIKSSFKNFYLSIDVPVFRVRATTASTSSTIKTDPKPISVGTPTNICYDPKQTHNTTTTGGSVSVLACFKTTKKRTKVCCLVTISVLSRFSLPEGRFKTSNPID